MSNRSIWRTQTIIWKSFSRHLSLFITHLISFKGLRLSCQLHIQSDDWSGHSFIYKLQWAIQSINKPTSPLLFCQLKKPALRGAFKTGSIYRLLTQCQATLRFAMFLISVALQATFKLIPRNMLIRKLFFLTFSVFSAALNADVLNQYLSPDQWEF